jgi:carboxymethylenebutenolidase
MNIAIKNEKVSIPVDDRRFSMGAYLAHPAISGQYPAVIIEMEIFGITDHIQDITNRVAKLGYLAIALDFYHRTEAGVSLPYNQEGRAEGLALMQKLTRAEVIQDVKDAMVFLRARADVTGKIGFLGFSIGGHIGYLAAAHLDIKATICFYAGWITNTDIGLSRPEPTVTLTSGISKQGGYIVYFVGDQDSLITADQIEIMRSALQTADVGLEIIVYPDTKHGFFCDQRSETFDEISRDDAWKRLQEVFAGKLS